MASGPSIGRTHASMSVRGTHDNRRLRTGRTGHASVVIPGPDTVDAALSMKTRRHERYYTENNGGTRQSKSSSSPSPLSLQLPLLLLILHAVLFIVEIRCQSMNHVF